MATAVYVHVCPRTPDLGTLENKPFFKTIANANGNDTNHVTDNNNNTDNNDHDNDCMMMQSNNISLPLPPPLPWLPSQASRWVDASASLYIYIYPL